MKIGWQSRTELGNLFHFVRQRFSEKLHPKVKGLVRACARKGRHYTPEDVFDCSQELKKSCNLEIRQTKIVKSIPKKYMPSSIDSKEWQQVVPKKNYSKFRASDRPKHFFEEIYEVGHSGDARVFGVFDKDGKFKPIYYREKGIGKIHTGSNSGRNQVVKIVRERASKKGLK